FQHAIVATNHSIELGSAIVTRSAVCTPTSRSRWAMGSLHRSSSALVTEKSAQVIAGRSGAASASSANRRGYEMVLTVAGPYDSDAEAGRLLSSGSARGDRGR